MNKQRWTRDIRNDITWLVTLSQFLVGRRFAAWIKNASFLVGFGCSKCFGKFMQVAKMLMDMSVPGGFCFQEETCRVDTCWLWLKTLKQLFHVSPQSIRSTCPGWSRMFVVKVKFKLGGLLSLSPVSTNHKKRVDCHHFKLLKVIFKPLPKEGHIAKPLRMTLCFPEKNEVIPISCYIYLARWTIRVQEQQKTRRKIMMYTSWKDIYI